MGELFSLKQTSLELVENEENERDDLFKGNRINNNEVKEEDDYLEKTIGAFGLWQAMVSVTVTLTRFIALWNVRSISFLAPSIDFFCVEFSDNVVRMVENSTCYDNCLKYKYSSVVGRTIIEDFGLICDRAWLASFTQSILMFGVLIGVSLFGWISDRFGRRTAMLQSTLLNAVSMVGLPFSSSYIIFTCIIFVIGIGTGGSFVISVVQIMEIIGKEHREVFGACSLIPDGIAEASLAGFAYFTSSWQSYTLSYGIATWFILVSIIFVPESPRWLVSHGKCDEAIKVIARAAGRNKLNTSNIKGIVINASVDLQFKNSEVVKKSYLDFLKSKHLFLMAITVFVIYFAMGICFYGVFQYVTIIGFDLYLTVVMLGLITIPFCPMSIILNRTFGRKMASIGLLAMMALTIIVLFFIPKGNCFGTILGVLSFVCNNLCYSIVYVYVSELFPTPLRNMSYALASSGANIGAMIAPFIATLSPSWIPLIFFCVFPIIAALCCLTLPETKGRNLKDTI